MTRPQDPKVPMIEGGQLRLTETFNNSEYGRVDEPHICVGVAVAQLADPPVIFNVQLLNPIRAGNNIIDQGQKDAHVQAGMNPVVHFDQHRCGYHQWLVGRLNKLAAGSVICIAPIQRRI